MQPATYAEIIGYLGTIPSASEAWAEVFLAARLTMPVIEQFVATMAEDPGSVLREAEAGILSEEIMKLNVATGNPGPGETNGRMGITLRAVLSASEQTRVVRLVSHFCQPIFKTGRRFGHNGHSVMNATRRATEAYLMSRVPLTATLGEIGPDSSNWLVSDTSDRWRSERIGNYKGSQPILGPRDSVRVGWGRLANLIVESAGAKDGRKWSEAAMERATELLARGGEIFQSDKIQNAKFRVEYLVSNDANYDIAFGDMPIAMARVGARAWFGCMVRAKGLTRRTQLKEGKLSLMGVNYRVVYKEGRIDFRHPGCSAFGYSHNVWEYLKYEENNGYVWYGKDAHYIYSKGPETTDELLFFSVVRVPVTFRMYEPRYVENPNANKLKLTSIWATGDEVGELPTSFSTVVFYVDELNFSKILEKRRALDHKGNFAITMSLVRSTNVRFWLNGTPVGVNERIQSRLAEATSIVVEAVAGESRLSSNMAFDKAMNVFELSMARSGWFAHFLESMIDFRVVVGKVTAPIVNAWSSLRATVMDTALSSISDVKVSVERVGRHVLLDAQNYDGIAVDAYAGKPPVKECKCGEIADVKLAMIISPKDVLPALRDYLRKLEPDKPCESCMDRVTAAIEATGSETEDSSVDASSDSDTVTEVFVSGFEEHVDGGTWRDDRNVSRPEACSMLEFCDLEQTLIRNELTELRIDSTRLMKKGIDKKMIADECTSRTKHMFVEVLGGRVVSTVGPDIGGYSAVFDYSADKIVPVAHQGTAVIVPIPDGWYYTCNRLKVWNGPTLISSVEYAMDYGRVSNMRQGYEVTLGVPGAGKTYSMMQTLSPEAKARPNDFLFLAVTKASEKAAKEYGKKFGLDESYLDARVMTLDKYLMHGKFQASVICVDEFPMVHIGKVDAAVSISGATRALLYGDAEQIPYNPFCAYKMLFNTLGRTVRECNVTFKAMTHRLSYDVCAMWLDRYPAIYPCDCCRTFEEKMKPTLNMIKEHNLADYRYDPAIRHHAYKRDDLEEVRSALNIPGSLEALKKQLIGGLATVHEDQGSTHKRVRSFRTSTVYDKNQSPQNPSLFNRMHYVLTDTTRHVQEYTYVSLCDEWDLVCKRIALSRDKELLSLVMQHRGLGRVTVMDMLL